MNPTNPTNPTRPDKGTFQTGRVFVLSACHFIHDAYSSFLAPLLPLLIEKLSLTLTQAGFLSTVMQIPALFNPYIGSLADRISVRYFIILAPAATAIPMSLLGLAPSYGVLLMLLFCAGISVAMFHVPAPVMVSRLSGTRVGQGNEFFHDRGRICQNGGSHGGHRRGFASGIGGILPGHERRYSGFGMALSAIQGAAGRQSRKATHVTV